MKNLLFTFSISFLFFSSLFSQTVTEKEFLNSNYETSDSLHAKYYRLIEKKQNYSTNAIITYFNIDGEKHSQGEYTFIKFWKKHGYNSFYDSTGHIYKTFNYKYDLLSGPFYFFYDNGSTEVKGTHFSSSFTDTLLCFYPSGSMKRIDLYKNGKFIKGQCFTSEGKDTIHTIFESESYFGITKEAEYPGGLIAMSTFITNNIIYPENAILKNIEGKCYLKFIIDRHGNVDNITVIRGIAGCPECEIEAIRVLKLMPKWDPAEIHGNPTESWFELPINFTLEKGKKTKP
jgi:protein TonB